MNLNIFQVAFKKHKFLSLLVAFCSLNFSASASSTSQIFLANTAATYILYAVVFTLLFGVLLLSLKLISTIFKLKGKKVFNWSDINGSLFLVYLIAFMAFVFWQFDKWGAQVMQPSGAEHGEIIDNMFIITTIITMFVFVITHILLFVFAFLYRERPGRKAYHYPVNDKLEVVWTIIPAIVMTILVTYGFKVWSDVTQNPPNEDEVNVIEVYAYQFGWKARYPGPDGKLGEYKFQLVGTEGNDLGIDPADKNSADDLRVTEIVLPVDEPVLFKFRSHDVIHSAYMPHFRLQMNVVPGMRTQFYMKPVTTTYEMRQQRSEYNFDYLLFCNKICGSAHFNMKMKVRVVERAEYDEWIKDQKKYFKDPEPEETAQAMLVE